MGGFELQFETNGDAEAMARPTLEGNAHDPQNEVHAPQRPVFLPGGARAIAGAGTPFDLGPGFFLDRIVEADLDDLARGPPLRRQADDGAPEGPALVVERAPKQDIEA